MFSLRRRPSPTSTRFRPTLEALEDRITPVVAHVSAAQLALIAGGDSQSAGSAFLQSKFATVFTTKIDWSGPGDPGPAESIGSANSGAGAGKVNFNEFTITKMTDRASPAFFRNSSAGSHYKTVTLHMRKASGDSSSAGSAFLQSKFATVFTTKIDWAGPGDSGPEESISFVYGKLDVKYDSQTDSPSNSSQDTQAPAITPPEQAIPTPTPKPVAAMQPAPATVGSFGVSAPTQTISSLHP